MRVLLPLLIFAAGLAGQAPGGWKAGVATAVITPREPIWMAGYGARTKPSEGVRQDLHAKALALEDASGAVSVLVSADLLGFTRDMAANVATRVEKRFGVPRARLALNASHTHSGPATGQLLRPAYDMNAEQAAVVERYTAALLDQLVEIVGTAIKDLAPAQLAFEQGLAGFAVNRRRAGHREYPGPVDHDVPVLTVRAPGGALRAIVFGYACHNTVLSDYQINGDYAGYAQAALEKEFPGAAALFIAGCGADANPLPRRSVELAQMYGQILAEAVRQVVAGKLKPVSGPLSAAFQEVDLPFQTPPSREELQARLKDGDGTRRRWARLLLDRLDRDGRLPDRHPYPVQLWQFGRDLTFIVLGGEVVADYSLRFKRQYGWDNLWVCGYSNDVFAYIPSLRVLKEGGYEGGGAMIPYGQPAPFRPEVEEIIANAVDRLVRSDPEKAIADQLRTLRQLPDDTRARTTKQLALEIRKLPPGPNKLRLAGGLANLSTEGDFGRDTLQEVATTLAEALREQPAPPVKGEPAMPYVELAQLVRYEHVEASLDDPQFASALAKLEADDQRRQTADFTLADLQGKRWQLRELRGKVVLVNFWATWCPPCRKEMPDLEALYNRFKDRGLLILAISDEDGAKVGRFIAAHKFTYPVLLDPGRKVNELFRVEGIPKSFVYDRDGKLVAQAIDMRTREQFLEMLGRAGLR